MNNRIKISLLNMLATCTLGSFLLMSVGGSFGDNRNLNLVSMALFPVGFIVTNIFLGLNIVEKRRGFFMGGLLSILGTIAAFIIGMGVDFLLVQAEQMDKSYILQATKTVTPFDVDYADGMEGFAVMFVTVFSLAVLFFSFFIGAFSGLIITSNKIKEREKYEIQTEEEIDKE